MYVVLNADCYPSVVLVYKTEHYHLYWYLVSYTEYDIVYDTYDMMYWFST